LKRFQYNAEYDHDPEHAKDALQILADGTTDIPPKITVRDCVPEHEYCAETADNQVGHCGILDNGSDRFRKHIIISLQAEFFGKKRSIGHNFINNPVDLSI